MDTPMPIGEAPPAPATRATYVARVLPPEEWEKLRAFPFAANGLPSPESGFIIVTETPDGTIVGIWACLLQPFLDGLWVDPDHLGSTIARTLLRTMKDQLRTLGVPVAFTIVSDEAVMAVAVKAGLHRAPGDLWVLEQVLTGGG
jgi:Acetyltransferase (GNAT) family